MRTGGGGGVYMTLNGGNDGDITSTAMTLLHVIAVDNGVWVTIMR